MGFSASCPSCSAEVEFTVSKSVVTVCDACGSVVGRADGKLEAYGKVADLVQSDSPLQTGVTGKVKGVPFEVAGRLQFQHPAGGVWDEWYLAFRDGEKWGWLAEAQGRYYLTFPKRLPQNHALPPVNELELEQQVAVPGQGVMKVIEYGEATAVAAEGEIPFKFTPQETSVYADLQGAAGKFATLGADDPDTIYIGREFPLERLGIAETAEVRESEARVVAATAVSCPQCGGSLDLRAPDETLRVVCPYCDSLLDADDGKLRFLQTLKQDIKPRIPLGSVGQLRGRRYTVIGFMQRTVKGFRWFEYLLHTPRQPFHWLIHSDRHWNLGKPISAGDVVASYRTAAYRGKNFRLFENSTPIVTGVYGEFYWKVSVGEQVRATDFTRPPYLLSREIAVVEETKKKNENRPSVAEVNYTLSEYVPVAEIEQAFGVTGLPRPSTVAPNQPYPHMGIYPLAIALLTAMLLAGGLVWLSSSKREVFSQTFALQADTASSAKKSPRAARSNTTLLSEDFQLKSFRNLRFTCQIATPSGLSLSGTKSEQKRFGRSWALIRGSLHRKGGRQVATFRTLTRASRPRSKTLSSVPAGTYSLRLEVTRTHSDTPRQLKVRAEQGVMGVTNWFLFMGLIGVVAVGVMMHHVRFELQRRSSDLGGVWQEYGGCLVVLLFLIYGVIKNFFG